MLEQLPHAHGADMLDHVQRDQRFPGIHAGWIPISASPGKSVLAKNEPRERTRHNEILRVAADVRRRNPRVRDDST
jgi:hypothetical protein